MKIYWKKIREDIVGAPSIVFTRQAVVDVENLQTYANQLLGSRLVNYTTIRCFNRFLPKLHALGTSSQVK